MISRVGWLYDEDLGINQPEIKVCNVGDILIDPSCGDDIDDAQYIIHKHITTFSKLKKSGYKDLDNILMDNTLDVINSEGNIAKCTSCSYSNGTSYLKDKPRQKVVVYEYWGYWDVNDTGKTEVIVVKWVGNTILSMDVNPLDKNKFPFVITPYIPSDNSVYGESDTDYLNDSQKIIGAVTRGIIDTLGRGLAGQTAYKKNALDTVNRKKADNGEDFELNNSINNPKEAIYQFSFQDVGSTPFEQLDRSKKEAQELTGIVPFGTGKDSTISANSNFFNKNTPMSPTEKREISLIRRIASHLTDIAKIIIELNNKYLSSYEIFAILDTEESVVLQNDIKNNPILNVNIKITTPEMRLNRANNLAFLLQTSGGNLDEKIQLAMYADFAKYGELHDTYAMLRDYQPQPNPIMEERAMLENELLKAQIANEMAKAEENKVDMQLKAAKARFLDSQSDLNDAKFMDNMQNPNKDIEDKLALARDNQQHQRAMKDSDIAHQQQQQGKKLEQESKKQVVDNLFKEELENRERAKAIQESLNTGIKDE